MRKTAMVMLLAATALVGACNRKAPGGQVAATVNGQEVTLQEINTELQAANVPPSVDKQMVQRALLQRVIDRKLLVAAADDKGLDKTPDYLMAKRRADELLLAQAFAKGQMAAVPVPSAADIDKFMADHPNVFGQRAQLSLDQIRFPTPSDPKVLAPLEGDHSMDAVAATLTRLGIKFARTPAGLDTANTPAPVIANIDKLPAGEPFIVPQPGMVTVNVITGRKTVPTDATASRPAAAAAWRQEKFNELLNKQLASLRSGAQVRYQPGFAPETAPAAGGTAGGTAPAATPKP